MDIPQESQNKHNIGNWWATVHSKKGMIVLLCALVLFISGMVVIRHSSQTTESVPAMVSQPVRASEARPVQELEKNARSMDKLANKPSLWPVTGEITSVFGWRNSPWGGGSEFHPGIDIANNMETPIVATADGEVVQSEPAGGYGNIVKINHGNGIETIYGHNAHLAVNAGQSVKKGQVIAYLGNTGRSTGPHLHYEVRVNGTAVDPISFLVAY
ncbi:hypothetical protein SRRS_53800 [Sporomusa rhizae]|uniref:M23 family metallopeptidase n=1 Tax=Sporomusa rhizae TaxID=357999 RepID=UPI003A619975